MQRLKNFGKTGNEKIFPYCIIELLPVPFPELQTSTESLCLFPAQDLQ